MTQRILDRLPGRREVWVLLWALVPWLNAGANLLLDENERSAIWDQSSTLIVLSYAAVSGGILLALWGSERVASKLGALQHSTGHVFSGDVRERFRELDSKSVPLAASALTAVVLATDAVLDGEWTAAVVRAVTWLVVGTALWTYAWTYGVLQAGLVRLGGDEISIDAAGVDPALGLRPLGDVAFTGLWIFLLSLVPIVLTSLPDVPGVVLGITVLALGIATFFFSLSRLHGRMSAAKAREIELARRLYDEAYRPVRATPTLETLERQRGLLAAAEALEQRALAIHDWPIDEGTVARVITIATSVGAITIARLILDPLGL